MEDDEKQELSQQFLTAVKEVNQFPATEEYFLYSILDTKSLTEHLNVDARLESCLKHYLLLQQSLTKSQKIDTYTKQTMLFNVASGMLEKIAQSDFECKTQELHY